MRTHSLIAITLVLSFVVPAALAQDDVYSRINPLEKSVAAGTASRADQLELARLYIQANRPYEASKIAQSLLATNPGDTDAAVLRDDADRALRDVNNRKVKDIEARASASGATDADRLALANAYYDAGSYAAAADLYRRLPASVMTRDTRLNYAHSLAWSGQHDAAETVYTQLLAEQSAPDLQLEYGRLLSWMGASDASMKTLNQVYQQTGTPASVVALANARAWSGDREGAIQLLNSYLASHPSAPEVSQLLTDLSASPETRMEHVQKMIDAQPYNLALRVEMARLQYDAGQYAAALKTAQFVRQHTSQPIPQLATIETGAREKRDAELAKLADQMKGVDTKNVQSADQMLALAKSYTALSDYDHAISLYESYLRLRPDDTEARINYARVLSWDKRWAASERQYEKLLEEHPDRADLRLEYAQILSWDADYVDAVNMFSSLTDLSNNPRAHLYTDVPARAHYNLGQVYRWYGWNEHALEEQNAALALDSDYGPAREELDLIRRLRPTSTADARYTFAEDSNDFTMHRVDLAAQKWTSRTTAFDASVGRHWFDQFGDQVSATNLSGGASYRFEDRWRGRARAGLNLYDQGYGTRPFWGLGIDWNPNFQSRAALDYNHYDLIYDVFTLSSLKLTPGAGNLASRDALAIDDLRGHYDYDTGGFWSWLADASFGRVTDSNTRAAAHGILSFRLLKEPFVALKGEGHYLTYDFRSPRYWSPPDYREAAAVLQIGQNVRNRFYWSVEGKLGKAWEQSTSSDVRAIGANVTVPISATLDLVGSYDYGKSGRFDSIVGAANGDLTNYWQRAFFVGVRLKQLYSKSDVRNGRNYYYDERPLVGSPVLPPVGETH